MAQQKITEFVHFLLASVYGSSPKTFTQDLCNDAFENTVKDVKYHYPLQTSDNICNNITSNKNELAIFLYRLGRELFLLDKSDSACLDAIHWLLKQYCSCELYFSSNIGEGFYIFHGEGTVIGSRNTIGKGLRLYQNVTIGHKYKDSPGVQIGNDVKVYAGAKILGNISIGSNFIVGSNTVVTKSIEDNFLVHSNPNILVIPSDHQKSIMI